MKLGDIGFQVEVATPPAPAWPLVQPPEADHKYPPSGDSLKKIC